MSQSESPANLCPQCGAALQADAPGTVCPRCALVDAMAVTAEEHDTQFLSLHDIPSPGQKVAYVGDYELLEVIARGGMGVVYRARQCSLNRVVALKMLLGGVHAGDDFRRRFRQEAETVAKLQHPNIVPIYEVGEHEGQPYFAMEYVAGETLAHKVQDHPLPAEEAARYVRAVAEAVHYAHGQGVLHRDLKPSNILIGADDRPRVTDFGLARQAESDSNLTMSGQALGTPGYLPPEQASGKRGEVGPPSDVYGLGAVLYHLLTGRPPFVTDSVAETLEQVRHSEPASPRQLNPAVPKDLETICLKCMRKEIGRRYPTAQELADDLGSYLRHEPIRARPVSVAEKLVFWCQRHPALALVSALAVSSSLFGLTGIVWQWLRAEHARDRVTEMLATKVLAQSAADFDAGIQGMHCSSSSDSWPRHRPTQSRACSSTPGWKAVPSSHPTPRPFSTQVRWLARYPISREVASSLRAKAEHACSTPSPENCWRTWKGITKSSALGLEWPMTFCLPTGVANPQGSGISRGRSTRGLFGKPPTARLWRSPQITPTLQQRLNWGAAGEARSAAIPPP